MVWLVHPDFLQKFLSQSMLCYAMLCYAMLCQRGDLNVGYIDDSYLQQDSPEDCQTNMMILVIYLQSWVLSYIRQNQF